MQGIAVRGLVAGCVALWAVGIQAQTVEAPAALNALLQKHYRAYGVGGDPVATFAQTTAADWANCSGNGVRCQTRDELSQQLLGLHKLVPDLNWQILDILPSRDKVVVRGQGAGTPAGDFFGVPHTGRSFKIMSIDIHTLKNGKIVHTHHLEDWAEAIGQLSGR